MQGMYFNDSSAMGSVSYILYCPTARSNDMWLFWGSLKLLLTFAEIIVPLYPLILLLMKNASIQRRALYAHKGHGLFFASANSNSVLDTPESQGFLRNQVTAHDIPTSDGQTLFAWLVTPIKAYMKNETVLDKRWSSEEASEIALQQIRSDPKAAVVVYMHGSGNNLATPWRCEAYRNISAGSPDHLYVLAFDWRGFGRSTGSPTEDGLITDAVSVLTWVEKKLCVPRAKVLIFGHSLGAGVATAAVQKVVEKNPFAEYAGMLLCSAASSMPEIAPHFKLGGLVPIIRPLTWFKEGRSWIRHKLVVDCWWTEPRLRDLIRKCEVIRISMIHAKDDNRVPSEMSDILYNACVDECDKLGSISQSGTDLGAGGNLQEAKVGGRLIRKNIIEYGGHNVFLNWHTVSFEVTRMLKSTGAID